MKPVRLTHSRRTGASGNLISGRPKLLHLAATNRTARAVQIPGPPSDSSVRNEKSCGSAIANRSTSHPRRERCPRSSRARERPSGTDRQKTDSSARNDKNSGSATANRITSIPNRGECPRCSRSDTDRRSVHVSNARVRPSAAQLLSNTNNPHSAHGSSARVLRRDRDHLPRNAIHNRVRKSDRRPAVAVARGGHRKNANSSAARSTNRKADFTSFVLAERERS